MKLGYLALVTLAVSAVAIADIFLKQASSHGASLLEAIKSPWMIGAVVLYLFQIFFFTYLFVSGAQLINIGVLQTVLYAVIVLLAGFLIFHESLSTLQIIGAALALVGVILVNLK